MMMTLLQIVITVLLLVAMTQWSRWLILTWTTWVHLLLGTLWIVDTIKKSISLLKFLQKLFYTVSHKKTCHFVSDNNSGIYWSIFILFVPVETRRNTLQCTYLMAWWRHNCIMSYVTKVCFIQLLHQVKYVEFEDRPKFFGQKPVRM